MLFCAVACSKEVFAVCPQTTQKAIVRVVFQQRLFLFCEEFIFSDELRNPPLYFRPCQFNGFWTSGADDKEIVALKQELTKCSAFKASLYQDLRDEIISKEQFTRYREEFSAKERELEQAIREQETIIRDIYENGIGVAKDLERFREGLVIGNLDRVALVSFIDRILIYDDFRVEIVFKYRQEMEKVAGLYDVANEKDAEPVYTMVDGLPVLELKEAV